MRSCQARSSEAPVSTGCVGVWQSTMIRKSASIARWDLLGTVHALWGHFDSSFMLDCEPVYSDEEDEELELA